MRLALLSDVHGNLPALEAVLRALAGERVDRILYAGDFVGYYPFVNEVIDRLRDLNAVAIRGNHERYLLEPGTVSAEKWQAYRLEEVAASIREDNLAWLRGLPEKREMTLNGVRAILCHGSPWKYDEYIYPDSDGSERFDRLDADVVIMGHTHIPFEKQAGSILLLNPGSCGQPRDYRPGACYAVYDTRSRKVGFRRAAYDIASLVKILAAKGYPAALIEILTREKLVESSR
ncbi:MAG: metallophosphoesterase family protein [Chloroflexota bacterium]